MTRRCIVGGREGVGGGGRREGIWRCCRLNRTQAWPQSGVTRDAAKSRGDGAVADEGAVGDGVQCVRNGRRRLRRGVEFGSAAESALRQDRVELGGEVWCSLVVWCG